MANSRGRPASAAITGLGVVSGAGAGVAASLESLRAGKRSPGPVTLFPTPLEFPVFEAGSLPPGMSFPGGRTLGLAMWAVSEALADAGLEGGVIPRLRVGVCMGTTVQSRVNDIEFYRAYRDTGAPPLEPVDNYLDGDLAAFVGRRIGTRGPCVNVVNACSSGTDAIGIGLSWLRAGLCDIVVAGGADEMSRIPYCGFGSLGVASLEPCAPFDRNRKGLNLGEGAGVLVMETEACARGRGVRKRAILAGYGSAADGYHLTAPHPEGRGLKASIARALEEAGATPAEVAFVNAHGTATHDNDKVEGRVLLATFGENVKVVSTKGYTGHALGAAGGIEAVFAVAGLVEGWIPASAGFVEPDPDIGLTPVREATAVGGRYAVSTSLAFGGNNAALVVGKPG